MKAKQDPPEVRRYYLSTPGSFEWAEVVISSGGFFAAVSDYGNYAFAWRSFGDRDFRSFLLNAEKDVDYFTKKIQPGGDGPGDIYEGEATARELRKLILEWRREGSRRWTRERARREWDLIADCSGLESMADFHDWYRQTSIDDAYEFAQHVRNPQAKAFVERILVAKLCPLFRAELATTESNSENRKDDR